MHLKTSLCRIFKIKNKFVLYFIIMLFIHNYIDRRQLKQSKVLSMTNTFIFIWTNLFSILHQQLNELLSQSRGACLHAGLTFNQVKLFWLQTKSWKWVIHAEDGTNEQVNSADETFTGWFLFSGRAFLSTGRSARRGSGTPGETRVFSLVMLIIFRVSKERALC